MIDVLIRRENWDKDMDTHTEEGPCEGRDRKWSSSQGEKPTP